MTNLECLTEIMTFSRYGALAQAFVMDALSQHAERVATTSLDQLQVNPMVSARAWQGVALEIHTKLEAHFAR
ncbi:hypothetical protein [Burkholderia thailandensis]|uniref:Uncharacterized protein n=1 Tax=Burkholderia thailandensis (strain ATCC 700388 / DSM 13276 / CCUG 48851 / CIP 106301 / E264) TaxID=271848 RepID=Q2SV08_BURTA|nr:hypothetical protein [Burkholderia thailandensis]ABC37279.1 hypothetical protein BTH_I2727 [Burkholderia thailandensis E264]AHI73784.1 hypothetical protein BTQ_1296 [Burkholderia thailandensis 2002721723]AIP25337.1 hypothetical protein DR63_3054 [Burkholderia thailandensis E264]AJX98728.1 hypothetical protein BG87_2621 [Burkholderia thailandensis 2002721643]KVG08792.1 hypothetical protein WJ25_00775 [Burkholderia thailandensis]